MIRKSFAGYEGNYEDGRQMGLLGLAETNKACMGENKKSFLILS